MMIDDIPERVTATHVGDMIYLPYSGKSLRRILACVRRMGWEYRAEPHELGTLLHCTKSPLGGNK